MTAEDSKHDYISDRLEEQIKWHGGKARENKRKFSILQTIIIVASASIAIVNVFKINDNSLVYIGIASSILGGIVVVISSLLQIHRYQENWILYRTTSELLKKEKYFYLNDAGSYSGLNAERKKKLLVENVETIVSAETSKYFVMHKPEQTTPQATST